MLAEVSDKMISVPMLVIWNVVIIVFAWWFMRKNRWLVLIPLGFAVFLALATKGELRDPHIGPAVIRELGYHFIVLNLLPLVVVTILSVKRNQPV